MKFSVFPIAAGLAATAFVGFAAAQSGLVGRATDLPKITLSSGMPLADAPYDVEAGVYYEIVIESDGSQELALSGGEFFRNVWVDEVVVNGIEVRPMGLHSLEFDDPGEASMSFIFIKPGTYELRIPGTTSENQAAIFNVKG